MRKRKRQQDILNERRGHFGDDEEFLTVVTDDGKRERLDIALGKTARKKDEDEEAGE